MEDELDVRAAHDKVVLARRLFAHTNACSSLLYSSFGHEDQKSVSAVYLQYIDGNTSLINDLTLLGQRLKPTAYIGSGNKPDRNQAK
ncbi:MAG: hypothetical protein QG604_166 [Candidatus Dependentiae bacterium]|nr:hypothetical protein [Candidatus Dependentiae bacterium]